MCISVKESSGIFKNFIFLKSFAICDNKLNTGSIRKFFQKNIFPSATNKNLDSSIIRLCLVIKVQYFSYLIFAVPLKFSKITTMVSTTNAKHYTSFF